MYENGATVTVTRVTRTTWLKETYLNASQQLEGGCREFVSFPLTLLARIPALDHKASGAGPMLEMRGV